jgi:multidrug transporter EmrE-like cation transporter
MSKHVVALVIALLLNAGANLMLKFGMHAINVELDGAGILSQGPMGAVKLLLRHWTVLAGLAAFALNVVFYGFALQKLQISVAYPVMVTVGFAIIAAVAGWRLGESLSMVQWVGVGAILLGVTLVASDAARQMGGTPSSTKAEAAE